MDGRVVRTLFATIFLLTLTAPSLTQAGPEWRDFRPPEQPFSVRMPGEVKQVRRVSHTIIGSVKTDVWVTAVDDSKMSVSITHLPRLAIWFKSRNGLYEKALDKMMEELGAEIGRIERVERDPFERRIFYRIPPRDGRPARSGRALLGLRDRKIVVVNGIAPADGVSLDDFFAGLSIDEETASNR